MIERWRENYQELLDPPQRPYVNLQLAQCSPYDINCEPPTWTEVKSAILKLKSRKVPGEDGIPAEALKTDCTVLIDTLHSLFVTIWSTETIPMNWHTTIILPIPKGGDLTLCSNYRGISLLDVAAKIFSAILLKRFASERDIRTRAFVQAEDVLTRYSFFAAFLSIATSASRQQVYAFSTSRWPSTQSTVVLCGKFSLRTVFHRNWLT